MERFNIVSFMAKNKNGHLINYDDHEEIIEEKDKEIEQLKKTFKEIIEYALDIYENSEVAELNDTLNYILKISQLALSKK